MELIINHKPVEIDATQIDLETLLSQLRQANTHGIAVAVNHKVIPKNEWESFTLKNGDQILIITATQGG